MPKVHPLSLPYTTDVAFGRKAATSERSFSSLCETVDRIMPGPWDMAPIGDGVFHYSASYFSCGALDIATISASPLFARQCDDVAYSTLFLPFAGAPCTYTVEGRPFVMTSSTAVLLSGRKRETEIRDSYSSGVHVPLNVGLLSRVATAMLGREAKMEAQNLIDEDRELPLTSPLAELFRNQWNAIDVLMEAGSSAGKMLGIDDQVYRLIAALRMPEAVFGQNSKPHFLPRQLRFICEYIDGHLMEPLPLSQLETVSGMSRRSLQYAFLKQFGCSPMEWVRGRRLEWAHRRLADSSSRERIIDIALACGFGHLGNFSRRYRERFGETPSETISRIPGYRD